ncbi:hypothetical protein BC830DRAFT_1087222, partial [Chytriomyces sp. MP71]
MSGISLRIEKASVSKVAHSERTRGSIVQTEMAAPPELDGQLVRQLMTELSLEERDLSNSEEHLTAVLERQGPSVALALVRVLATGPCSREWLSAPTASARMDLLRRALLGTEAGLFDRCELLHLVRHLPLRSASDPRQLDSLLKCVQRNGDEDRYLRGIAAFCRGCLVASHPTSGPFRSLHKARTRFTAALRLWDSVEPSKMYPSPFSCQMERLPPVATYQQIIAFESSDYNMCLHLAQKMHSSNVQRRLSEGASSDAHEPKWIRLIRHLKHLHSLSDFQNEAFMEKIMARVDERCDRLGCRAPESWDLKLCSRCRAVRYCSTECQRESWTRQNHRLYCRNKVLFEVGDLVAQYCDSGGSDEPDPDILEIRHVEMDFIIVGRLRDADRSIL